MYNRTQFLNSVEKLSGAGHTLDKSTEFALSMDAQTGSPDNLNRLAKALEKLPGRKLQRDFESFVNETTIFRIKENGHFGRVKGREPSESSPPLFSAYMAEKEAKAAEKRKEAAAKRKAAKAAADKRPVKGRLKVAAEAAVAEVLKKFGSDVAPDIIQEAVYSAAIRACQPAPKARGAEKRQQEAA